MAAWCFVCDVPVEGSRCPTCRREPTVVEEHAEAGDGGLTWWRRIPRGAWIAVVVIVVIVSFALQQSGFRLGSG